MRLINTKTYELRNWSGRQTPPYAILSHRWMDDELSLAQFTDDTYMTEKGYHSKGWTKIQRFCDLVADRTAQDADFSVEWVWVDTCCIDKSSSAELSETINSMFNWYKEAEKCFVYLFDVNEGVEMSQLGNSDWFARGWTLQELLAPQHIEFLNSSWKFFGTKQTLCERLSSITSIPLPLLYDPSEYSIEWTSVAQRMSWAAHRVTARKEDMVYSLLGLFGVNMPLLYGEGAVKAFRRLQLEVIGQSDDDSIFTWIDLESEDNFDQATRIGKSRWSRYAQSLLADRPSWFACSMYTRRSQTKLHERRPWMKNNLGLSMHRSLCPFSDNMAYLKGLSNRSKHQLKSPNYGFSTRLMPIDCVQQLGHTNKLALSLAPLHLESNVFVTTGLYEYDGVLENAKLTEFIVRWDVEDVEPFAYDNWVNPAHSLSTLTKEIKQCVIEHYTEICGGSSEFIQNLDFLLRIEVDHTLKSKPSDLHIPSFSVAVIRKDNDNRLLFKQERSSVSERSATTEREDMTNGPPQSEKEAQRLKDLLLWEDSAGSLPIRRLVQSLPFGNCRNYYKVCNYHETRSMDLLGKLLKLAKIQPVGIKCYGMNMLGAMYLKSRSTY